MKTILIALLVFSNVVHLKAQHAEIFAPGGKAIKGYDAVAFFKEAKAIKGIESFSFHYKDATWLFADKANLEAFKASPEKYAPQYGGYCAFGTSKGYKAPTETDTWTVVNDKLYFNYNAEVKELWNKDRQNLIQTADKLWPEVKTQKF